MRSERAQGTVEYVGVLLVVAALLVALAGGLGVSGMLARSVAQALESAFGAGHVVAAPGPSQAERERFAEAVDPTLPPDSRPSLGAIRLELIERHGDVRGRALYRALVVEEVRRVVPGLGGTTRFGSLGPMAIRSLVLGRSGGIERSLALARATIAPRSGDPGELETPIGEPDVHVVTTSEEDTAFQSAQHPGVDYTSIGEDVVGLVPFVGTATHLGRLAAKGVELASTAATLIGAADDARQLGEALSPSAAAITPGTRAGDIVVTWLATRRSDSGTAISTVERGAVVRDGRVVAVALNQRS